MDNFFNPSSIAIIGASEQPGKIGNILVRNLLDLKYPGKIYPINPKHEEIEGLAAYKSIKDIKEKVDLAIIAIPAAFVPTAVLECAEKSSPTQTIIVISAGFSESGDEGKKLEKELKDLAQKYSLQIAGPNCLGTLNPHHNLNASFSKNNFKKGSVGLIMQSGAFTTALFDLALAENFGFSLVATLGNKAVLDEVDFMQYFAKDKNTKLIALYLEDIKRGSQFCKTLRKISKTKPVLILKAGNSQKAQKAMLSHTGAMAGQADVAKEAIIGSGGLYFDNLADFFSAIKMFNGFKSLISENIVLVTNAGGPGVIVTDLIEKKENLHLIEFDSEQKKKFKAVLPDAASVENPVDVLGDADDKRYGDVLNILDGFDKVGAAVVIVTPQAQTDIEKIAQVILAANESSKFPVYPVFIGSQANAIADEIFKAKGLGNFMFMEGLINVIQNIVSSKQVTVDNEIKPINVARQKDVGVIFNELENEKRKVFYYQEAAEVAKTYGLKPADFQEIAEPSDIDKIAYFPVVMKVDSPNLLHKNTKNGVVLNIDSPEKARQAYQTLRENFAKEKIIIQPQEKAGLEIIMGIKKDPRFGQVLMLGLGGIMTEILGKKILWVLPTSREQIEQKIRASFFEKLFEKQKIDITKLINEIIKLKSLATEQPEIEEMDINPILFYSDRDPVCVDIKIII